MFRLRRQRELRESGFGMVMDTFRFL
jgi:hypothetical protein